MGALAGNGFLQVMRQILQSREIRLNLCAGLWVALHGVRSVGRGKELQQFVANLRGYGV